MSKSASKSVPLDDSTYARVRLLARAWGVNEGEAIRRLVEYFEDDSEDAPAAPAPAVGGSRPVHVVYEGNRVEGLYDPATKSLEITTGPAAGWYKSPSGAAAAVLQAYNPKVAPNRNGWSFFILTESDELLQTIRHSG
ncbi:hypothetical protein ACWEO1_23170 [Kitasatospora cineracea]